MGAWILSWSRPIEFAVKEGEKYFSFSLNIFTALIDLVHPIFPGGVGNGLEISQSKLLHCNAWCSQKMEFAWKYILSIFEQMRIYMRIFFWILFTMWSVTKFGQSQRQQFYDYIWDPITPFGALLVWSGLVTGHWYLSLNV